MVNPSIIPSLIICKSLLIIIGALIFILHIQHQDTKDYFEEVYEYGEDIDCFGIWEGYFPQKFCCHILSVRSVCQNYVLFSNTLSDLKDVCGFDVKIEQYVYPDVLKVKYVDKYSGRVNKVLISDYVRAVLAHNLKAVYIDLDFIMFDLPRNNFMLWDSYEDYVLNGIFNLTECPDFLSGYIRLVRDKLFKYARDPDNIVWEQLGLIPFTRLFRKYKEQCNIQEILFTDFMGTKKENIEAFYFSESMNDTFDISDSYGVHLGGLSVHMDVDIPSKLETIYNVFNCSSTGPTY